MKKLLRLKAMLLLCALIAGSGSVWADADVTFTSTDVTASSAKFEVTKDDVTISCTQGTSTNGQIRIFKSQTITVSSTKNITSIVFTCTANGTAQYGPGCFTCSDEGYTYESNGKTGTWTGSAKSITFTASANQVRATSIEVTLEAAATSIPTPELSVATGSEVALGSTVTISNYDNGYVYYYTTDGTAPAYDETTLAGIGSTEEYNDGIVINGDVTVKVLATDYTENSAVATYAYTYKRGTSVDPVGPTGSEGKFVKVTDATDLTNGDYLIVYETGKLAFNGGLETLDAANNNFAVTITDGVIAETEATKAAVFTIDISAGTIKAANGQYIGVTSNSNGLKTSTTSTTYSNSFDINDSGNALIKAEFDGSTMYLNYNSDSNQNRFRYFKNGGQKAIQLYKYVPGSPADQFDVTISDAGYKTLVSTVDFKTQTGTTAYIVTASSASSATLTSVSEVPAGTPVILKGSGTVTLDVIDNAAAVNGNLLQVSTESTGNGVYVLADKDGVGFYKWTGGSLGAGRVYLPAPAAAAREFLSFDFEETTGINNVESSKLDVEGFYNLAGQRVAQPTKGLYIVNGKKVIIK